MTYVTGENDFCQGLEIGYVTEIIAREQAMKAVLIMGVIGSLIWLAGAIAMWEFAYPWYNILGVLTGVPFSILGGRLYLRRKRSEVTSHQSML